MVRLGAIGDVVNALVFASALRDAVPGVEIGWVVHPLAAPLVTRHPSVDRVHLWERGGGLAGFRRVLREVRAVGYGLAVDLQRLQKSALLARLSGAPRVLGYDRARAKELSWLWSKERIPGGPPHEHMVDQVLGFARYLGIGAGPRHVLPSDPDAEEWAEGFVAGVGAAPILLNLGASKRANLWPAARFGELARALEREHDAPVVLTGGPTDRAAEGEALAAWGRPPRDASAVGRTDLLQLAALQRRSRLFVSADTGPMHMAVAVGLPTLALFGAADPRRTGPYGGLDPVSPHRVLVGSAPCAPCSRKTCNRSRHACMQDIAVERVVSEVLAMLC